MGIDTLFQLIAVGAFLLGFAGVAMVVMAASRGNPVGRGIALAAVGIIAGIIFMVISEGLVVVHPTERAVVFNVLSGDLEEVARGPGLAVIIPGIQQAFIYDVSQQNYTMSDATNEGTIIGADAVAARSVDGQQIRVDVTILFHIDPDGVNTLHLNWPNRNYTDGFIRSTVREEVRNVMGAFQAEQIYSASRSEVTNQIAALLEPQFIAQGLTLLEVQLRDVNFSPEFIAAIEQRVVAGLERDRASVRAEQVRIEAEGRADATIETARGEAESIRIRAQAEADALRVVSEQIAANPNLIQYLYVTHLSDNVNMVMVPSTSPFLFDASSFTQMSEDFTAPEGTRIIPNTSGENNSGG